MLFQPDIFSASRPGWFDIDETIRANLSEVLAFLPRSCRLLDDNPQQSSAFGINSSNFRFFSGGNGFILKRWSQNVSPDEVQVVLKTMAWLASMRLPVPLPIQFCGGEVLLTLTSGKWSLFPFVEGNYFSGAADQLRAVAEITGRLTEALQLLPSEYALGPSPKYFSNQENKILCETENNCPRWGLLFGSENATLLSEWWPKLRDEWSKLSESPPSSLKIQAAHFDLHPHNVLATKNKITAVLDFESCRQMDPGYALGFAALKQCRQVVAYRNNAAEAHAVGAQYITTLLKYCNFVKPFVHKLGDFAVSEALRRICLILNLNLNHGNAVWNHVLSVQIKHIGEARKLFGE